MTETKRFHIGDVLSAATGKLVSPRHMEGVYEILNWMTGDNLFTHQLPRAMDECAPLLRETFPDLVAANIPENFRDMADCVGWLETLYAEHGEFVDVPRLSDGDHTRIDPIAEAHMVAPHAKIIEL